MFQTIGIHFDCDVKNRFPVPRPTADSQAHIGRLRRSGVRERSYINRDGDPSLFAQQRS